MVEIFMVAFKNLRDCAVTTYRATRHLLAKQDRTWSHLIDMSYPTRLGCAFPTAKLGSFTFFNNKGCSAVITDFLRVCVTRFNNTFSRAIDLLQMPCISLKGITTNRANPNHIWFTARSFVETLYRTMSNLGRWNNLKLFTAKNTISVFPTPPENSRTVSATEKSIGMFRVEKFFVTYFADSHVYIIP